MANSPEIEGEEQAPPSAAELEAAGQSALFGAPVEAPAVQPAAPVAAPAAATHPAQPYRVLARKYRPQTFAELIGQDAMVQTLANAITRERLAHAFLMTGVRGVGKTSTARLIAKALNCIGPDGQGGPTIDPCGVCEPCVAIAEGRHIDVIEMDAASHTGVDDVREIIEAVRYAAVSARYKIYIIDEVHMLSRNAFNALLKTLEEPPRACEVPVRHHRGGQAAGHGAVALPAVRSAAHSQRSCSDEHFAEICAKEGVEAEPEALAMIAAAAEGSARDGLSILDQAIAHADLDGGGQGHCRAGARHARPGGSRRAARTVRRVCSKAIRKALLASGRQAICAGGRTARADALADGDRASDHRGADRQERGRCAHRRGARGAGGLGQAASARAAAPAVAIAAQGA